MHTVLKIALGMLLFSAAAVFAGNGSGGRLTAPPVNSVADSALFYADLDGGLGLNAGLSVDGGVVVAGDLNLRGNVLRLLTDGSKYIYWNTNSSAIEVTGPVYPTATSGGGAFQMNTGARIILVTGGADYLSCDGTTCTFTGTGVSIGGQLSIPSGGASIGGDMVFTGSSDLLLSRAVYLGTGGSAKLYVTNTAPTVPVACTTPTITSGSAGNFKADVGTTCAGVSTFSFTLPATTTGWHCVGRNLSNGLATLEQSGAESTTGATMTNFTRTTGLALVFTDGDDLRIACTGG